MSARDVVANADVEFLRGVPVHPGYEGANAILSALTAAGYRIIAPGELDPVTIERCAAIAIRQAPATQDFADAPLQAQANRIATALRNLGGQNG